MLNGFAIGKKMTINTQVRFAVDAVIDNCLGPVKMADGKISQKRSTNVTESMTAA